MLLLEQLRQQVRNSGRLYDSGHEPGDVGGQFYYEINADVLDGVVDLLEHLAESDRAKLNQLLGEHHDNVG